MLRHIPLGERSEPDIGQGEVDFEALFGGLHEIGFDGIPTSCVFAWEERAEDSARFDRAAIDELVTRHFG
jgi:myo-inositol catabolism protein IolH